MLQAVAVIILNSNREPPCWFGQFVYSPATSLIIASKLRDEIQMLKYRNDQKN
jgi:hypothetical protein